MLSIQEGVKDSIEFGQSRSILVIALILRAFLLFVFLVHTVMHCAGLTGVADITHLFEQLPAFHLGEVQGLDLGLLLLLLNQ